ncbi:MAG: hypothetical protein IJH39_04540 [Clostridia bacterium]|nr:hypothetical protein [Clostridia bacterium]
MEAVKKYTINILRSKLLGKKVHFTSDCKLFPNFNITGKVIEITMSANIPLIKTVLPTGRIIHVDGGMSNLQFEVLK